MESLPKDSLLQFNPDTFQYLRKQYDLDTPGRMEEAIEILSEWLKKQEHFLRKEFPVSGSNINYLPDHWELIPKVKITCYEEWVLHFNHTSLDKGVWYKSIQAVPSQVYWFQGQPWFDDAQLSRNYIKLALRIRSGHYPSAKFAYLMKKADSPNCPVCHKIEDVQRFLMDCDRNKTKDYLERTIIISKGSVERAKKKLDSICTYRTLYPEYFTAFNIKNNELLDDFYGSFLPKLTSDHYRVYAVRNKIKKNYDVGFVDFYRFFLMQCEYVQAHDYCNGLIIFVDYSDSNIMESLKWINISDVKRILDIMKEGYGMRIKGIHFYTESKSIDALVTVVKQGASQKVGSRIQVHKTMDKIHEYIPKEIMPVEYGGQEKPLVELHKKMRDICSTEFKNYLEEIRQAGTNENLRREDAVNKSHYMGISGTFRSLNVD